MKENLLLLKDLLKLKDQNLQIHDINIKNVYIDKLDDKVNEYNNTYDRTIKMKPVDVKDNAYINFKKKLMIKILNLKLVIM